jgi:hypothetical protein
VRWKTRTKFLDPTRPIKLSESRRRKRSEKRRVFVPMLQSSRGAMAAGWLDFPLKPGPIC